jgi:rhamnogalacturonan endolyase
MARAVRRRTVLAAGAATPFIGTVSPAAFGVTSSGGYYTVDTGAGLVFKVSQTNGDITSFRYNGTELQPSNTNGSHVESGLGSSATVTASQSGSTIVITESVGNWYGSGTLVHYLVVRSGENTV